MKNKILYIALGLLAAVCLTEAIYIFAFRPATVAAQASAKQMSFTPVSAAQSHTSVLQQKQQQITQAAQQAPQGVNGQFFDNVFNDDFFAARNDPFEQMRNMQMQTAAALSAMQKDMFNSSWNSWYKGRFDMGDFKTETRSTGNKIELTITIPGLQKGTSNLDINKDRIKISFSTQEEQKQQNKNSVMQSTSVQNYTKIIPIPYGADASKVNTKTEGDKITIIFDKK